MTTKILSRESYYLDNNGWFVRKSPWIKRFKALAVTMLFSIALYPNEVVRSSVKSGMDILSYNYSPAVKEVVYQEYIKSHRPELTNSEITSIIESAKKWGAEFKVDEKMLFAIMTVESTFNQYAISNSGAFGIMQVIPKWHLEKILEARKQLGNPEVFDPNTNIFLGAWVYRDCLNKFKKTEGALLCYNGSNESPNGYDKKVMISYNNLSTMVKKVK